jgi:hypothetical protein
MVGQAGLAVCILLAGSLGIEDGTESLEAAAFRAWRIAPEVSHYRYREPGVMKNEGTLYGIVASYTFDNDTLDYLDTGPDDVVRLEGRLGFGEVDYDGSYMDGTPLSTSGSDEFLFNLRLLWGREYPGARFLDGIYAGLGYRYLNDDSSAQAGGYERESNYLYVPLGGRKDFELTPRWDLSITGEFDVLIIGRQISHLSDADPMLPDVRNWQWPGIGVGLSAEVRHEWQDVDLGFAPFLRYWWVAESNVDQGYYEPENNTFEYGLSFVVRF